MKKYLSLLLLLTPLLLCSCLSYKEIELGDVTNVKLEKGNNGGADIKVSIPVKNPNNYKIKVKAIEADLFVNNKKIGKITLNKKVVLPKNSELNQDFYLNTQLSNILSAVPTLLFGGEINLKVNGYIKGKVFIVSHKFPIEAEKKISAKDLDLF